MSSVYIHNPVAEKAEDAEDACKVEMSKALQEAAFGTTSNDSIDEAEADAMYRSQWGGLLHPDTSVRGVYDMSQLCIMLYLGWLLPVRLAFNKGASGPIEVALDLIIDASVMVDIFLQMHMYYYDDKTRRLVTDQKAIKRDYLRSWFFIDFFSVVPLDQVLFLIGTLMLDNGTSNGVIAWGYRLLEWSVSVRMMRLLRLVRLAKIKQLLNMDKVVHNIYLIVKRGGISKLQVAFYFRILFLVMVIVSSGHFLGCIWLMLGRHNVLQLQNPTGWMLSAYEQPTTNMTKDFISCSGSGFDPLAWNLKHGSSCVDKYKCTPIPKEVPYDVDCSWIKDRTETLGGTGSADGVGASAGEQYLSAFYFSLVTVTTVGYGDILPETDGEKRFVVTAIMLGAFLYAYIIGDFSNLLSNLSQERDIFDAKMRSVNDLLAYIDAPVEVREKVQSYYDFKFNNKEGASEIINELPIALQTALIECKYGKLIKSVPFFSKLHRRAVVDLCREMVPHTVGPGDVIMEMGEWHDELLILSKGTAKSTGKDGSHTTFEAGAFWGEMEFLGLRQQRTLTVIADLYCEVASISPDSIVPGSPTHNRLKAYGELRMQVEDKIDAGEEVDMKKLMQDFNETVEGDEAVESEEPVSPRSPPGGRRASEDTAAIVSALQEMRRESRSSQRQTDELTKKMAALSTQLDALSRRLPE